MKKSAIHLTPTNLLELKVIHELFHLMEKKPMHDILNTLIHEIGSSQPALPGTLRHLVRTGRYDTQQQTTIARMIVVIYCWYVPKLPLQQPTIDDPLYRRMSHNHMILNDSYIGRSKEENRKRWLKQVEEYPSKCLYGELHSRCVSEPQGVLQSLPAESRVFLLHNFKVVMDCFEYLVRQKNKGE